MVRACLEFGLDACVVAICCSDTWKRVPEAHQGKRGHPAPGWKPFWRTADRSAALDRLS